MRLRFDCAYSISVIQHFRADERRALLTDMSWRVRPGGLVVLTVGLIRDSDYLWNGNRGVVVEEQTIHGKIQDVIAEGGRVGLDIFRLETVRGWGDPSVDIGLVAMRRNRLGPRAYASFLRQTLRKRLNPQDRPT